MYYLQTADTQNLIPYIKEAVEESDDLPEGKVFKIIMENHEVSTHTNLGQALENVLALCFILNLSFPKKLSATLEFFHTYYLKYNLVHGKSTLKNATKNKVFNLIKKLSSQCNIIKAI